MKFAQDLLPVKARIMKPVGLQQGMKKVRDYRSFTEHSNDFETYPWKRLRLYGLSQVFILTNLIIKSLQKF